MGPPRHLGVAGTRETRSAKGRGSAWIARGFRTAGEPLSTRLIVSLPKIPAFSGNCTATFRRVTGLSGCYAARVWKVAAMSEVSLTGWMKALIAYVRSGEPDLTNRQMA